MGKGLQPIKDMELGVQEQCTEDEIQQCYKGWTDSEKKKKTLEARRPARRLLQKFQHKVKMVQNETRKKPDKTEHFQRNISDI